MNGRRLALVAFVLAVLGLGVQVGGAWAVTTVSRAGNVITITGGDEVNYVDQPSNGAGGPLLYSDPAGINFGAGCADAGTGNTVVCGNAGPGLVARVSLGGGDDTFRPEAVITTFPRLIVDLGAGNDTMWGSGNGDEIAGGPGDDVINARDGNDTIDGGEGRDRLSGAAGDDVVIGGPGVDSLFGDGEFTGLNFGNDTLRSADGEIDSLSCGFGADSAVSDANDVFDVLGECESRSVAAPAGGGGGGGGGGKVALAVTLTAPKTASLTALLAGKPFAFKLRITGPCTVAGGLVLDAKEAKRLKVGTKQTIVAQDAARVPKAGTYPASLELTAAFRKKLAAADTVNALLAVVCQGAGGATPADAKAVVFRR
jgi:hypothetical protein